MPETAPTPAEIAAKLTKAQRRFVRRGYVSDRRGYWPMYNTLVDKGLIDGAERLTPLGLAVRAILKDTPDAG